VSNAAPGEQPDHVQSRLFCPMGVLERRALCKGVRQMCLGVEPHNANALRLWLKLGYEAWARDVYVTSSPYEQDDGSQYRQHEEFLPMSKELARE
jgi:hypothetical protein